MFAFGLRKPAKCTVRVTNQRINDGNLIGRNPLFSSSLQNLLQYDLSLFASANGCQHMGPFCTSRRSLPGKDSFLIERSQRFAVHSFLLIGPAQHCMRSNSAEVEVESLATLLDCFIILAEIGRAHV